MSTTSDESDMSLVPDLPNPVLDHIYLRNLRLSAIVGRDAWDRAKPQPIVVSVRLSRDISAAGLSDSIRDTVSYGQVCKDIMEFVQERREGFESILNLNDQIDKLAMRKQWGGIELQISTVLPKGSLRAEDGLGLSSFYLGTASERASESSKEWFSIGGLKLPCIIGVNTHERLEKQLVTINLRINIDRFRKGCLKAVLSHWRHPIAQVVEVNEPLLHLGTRISSLFLRLWKPPPTRPWRRLQQKLLTRLSKIGQLDR